MTPEDNQWLETGLTHILKRYRESCDHPEIDKNFMPGLWARIEAKRKRVLVFERAARALVGAGVALSLVLGGFLTLHRPQPSAFYSESFVEQIATDNTSANGTFFEPVRLELTATEQHAH